MNQTMKIASRSTFSADSLRLETLSPFPFLDFGL